MGVELSAGHTALVTGASSGIGRAFATELARRGMSLVLVARDTARLQALAEELPGRHEVLTADLTDPARLADVAARVADADRPVELLVNNAGASLKGWFGTTDISAEDRQLDLLVRAPMHLLDAAIKAMGPRGHGGVINVASVAAFTPRGAYSAHKAWLANLSQWANWEYGRQGIVIQGLCPGFVHTEFHQRLGSDMSDIPSWMWLDAAPLVRASLADLAKGKALSVPSLKYKVLTTLARHAPTGIVARVAKRGR